MSHGACGPIQHVTLPHSLALPETGSRRPHIRSALGERPNVALGGIRPEQKLARATCVMYRHQSRPEWEIPRDRRRVNHNASA